MLEFEGEDKELEEDFREALLLQMLEEGAQSKQLILKITDAEMSRQGNREVRGEQPRVYI